MSKPYLQSYSICSIDWDQQKEFFNTKSPLWFHPSSSYVSLPACIVFFLEISLWVHYNAYVKGLYRVTKEDLNAKIFVKKEGNFINVKNELGDFWSSI